MNRGGIILCGGHSRRMGVSKALLPFGPELMLQRIVRLLGEVCKRIVVVAAGEQTLPELGEDILIARDRRPDRGPLEALAAGLHAMPSDVAAAYVTSCDVPLLATGFVLRLFELLGEHSAAVPVSGGFHHPLSAVYRCSLSDVVEALLNVDRLRPSDLFDIVPTRRVSEAELRDVDPRLDTLKNLNLPADYLAALAEAGFTAPGELLARLGQSR